MAANKKCYNFFTEDEAMDQEVKRYLCFSSVYMKSVIS